MTDAGSEVLATRLSQLHGRLVAYAQQHAGAPLLRFESAEDLAQGIAHEALRSAARFDTTRDRSAQEGWVFTIAQRYLASRRDHWFALKRRGSGVLRLTLSGDGSEEFRLDPADTATGPNTFAFRREQLVLITRALELLLPRDSRLVQWTSEGAEIAEIAARLDLDAEAARRARTRAFARFRAAYALAAKSAPRRR